MENHSSEVNAKALGYNIFLIVWFWCSNTSLNLPDCFIARSSFSSSQFPPKLAALSFLSDWRMTISSRCNLKESFPSDAGWFLYFCINPFPKSDAHRRSGEWLEHLKKKKYHHSFSRYKQKTEKIKPKRELFRSELNFYRFLLMCYSR